MLVTCYLVPLLFFAVMGGIFTSLMPEAKDTLIQSMTVMGVSMGALIGVPSSVFEICGSNIKKMYEANGVPLHCGLLSSILSAFVHLFIMSVIIFAAAPAAFDAVIPSDLLLYFILTGTHTASAFFPVCHHIRTVYADRVPVCTGKFHTAWLFYHLSNRDLPPRYPLPR